MRWLGRPNWPPEWRGPYGPGRPLPQGEVGTLVKVDCRSTSPFPSCYFEMQCDDGEYGAVLYFDDSPTVSKLCQLLENQVGRDVAEIGSLDVDT